jgi:hypothetical protein
VIEVGSQLAEEKDLLDCGKDGHVVGLDSGESNCALKFAAPHHWTSAHHGDESRFGAPAFTIAE